MALKHFMMLSDLYVRIGQILREEGDAPIGEIKTPPYPGPYVEADWIAPHYVSVGVSNTFIGKAKIKSCQITIE